jgi:hypothetical protein
MSQELKRKIGWKFIQRSLRVIEVLVIVIGVTFTAVQIRDLRNNESAQLMLEFNRSLSDSKNSKIITAIEKNKAILQDNGGDFTTTDIADPPSLFIHTPTHLLSEKNQRRKLVLLALSEFPEVAVAAERVVVFPTGYGKLFLHDMQKP